MKVPTALEVQVMYSLLTDSDDQFTILSCYRLQKRIVKHKQKLKKLNLPMGHTILHLPWA